MMVSSHLPMVPRSPPGPQAKPAWLTQHSCLSFPLHSPLEPQSKGDLGTEGTELPRQPHPGTTPPPRTLWTHTSPRRRWRHGISLRVSKEYLGRVPGVCLGNQVSEPTPWTSPRQWGPLPGDELGRAPRGPPNQGQVQSAPGTCSELRGPLAEPVCQPPSHAWVMLWGGSQGEEPRGGGRERRCGQS